MQRSRTKESKIKRRHTFMDHAESVGHSTHSLTVNNQFLYFCTSETFLQAVMFSFIV